MSAEQKQEAVVKPLEWVEPHLSHSYPVWRAMNLNIRFEAVIDTGRALSFGKYPLSISGHTIEEKFNTLEAAQAFAQADYERRIRSALVAPAASSQERIAQLEAICREIEGETPPPDEPREGLGRSVYMTWEAIDRLRATISDAEGRP